MRIRIIAGQFGGRFIAAPKSDKVTHPMSERVRGSLFNMLGDINNQKVLDAFAGTGALGLEALSRGALSVTFLEKDRGAASLIKQNISELQVESQSKLINASVASWLDTAKETKFDLILVDPPYHNMQLSTVVKLINCLKPNGLMILSYPGRESTPTVNGVVVVDNRSYGDAALAFYRLEE